MIKARTYATLQTIANLSKDFLSDPTLKGSVRFFIKGGAAVHLLVNKDPLAIDKDIDAYLMIDPADPAFETKRTHVLQHCISVLVNVFKPTVLEYGSGGTRDETLDAIQKEACCKPFVKEMTAGTAPCQIFVYANLLSKGVPYPLTLITVKQLIPDPSTKSKYKSEVFLDIIVPQKGYDLLPYHWDTIETQFVALADLDKPVPIMNTVSAYVNQMYAAAKSGNIANQMKRKGRANTLLKTVRTLRLKTQKAKRVASLSKVETNRDLFDAILSLLPNNANRGASMVMGTGAGAGAGAAAAARMLPALPPSPPASPPRLSPAELRAHLLREGKEWVQYGPDKRPLYTEAIRYAPPAGKEILLRSAVNGTISEIFDLATGERMALIEYRPTPYKLSSGIKMYRAFVNGVPHTELFNPAKEFFDPLALRVVRR
jgi:hypothetical protein